MPIRTFADQITHTGGRTTGFDYLRIGLACGVVAWHSVPLSYGPEAANAVLTGPWRSLVAIVLPAFFALSGFLVAGSLERNRSLLRFGALRALRILPALGVEVVLSAMILGPLLTTVPLADYFTHPKFLHYFANVIGRIHFELPGVFAANPYPNIVNGQLWTVPFELECYAALALLAALGIVRRRWLFMAVIAAAIALLIGRDILSGDLADATGALPGRLLVVSFLAGVLLYGLRDVATYSWSLFWMSLAGAMVSLALPLGDYAAPLFCAYIVGFLGLQTPKANVLVKFGDYSYGVFLYGFAVQQVVATLGPWAHHWYVNLGLTLPAVTLFAAFSWNAIEKPALALRSHLDLLDGWDRRIAAIEAGIAARVAGLPALWAGSGGDRGHLG